MHPTFNRRTVYLAFVALVFGGFALWLRHAPPTTNTVLDRHNDQTESVIHEIEGPAPTPQDPDESAPVEPSGDT